jgi:hypothetical protein
LNQSKKPYPVWKHWGKKALKLLFAAVVIGMTTFAVASMMQPAWSLPYVAAVNGLTVTVLYILNNLRSNM